MNTATQNLEKDHDYILRLISVMGTMAGRKVTDVAHVKIVIGLIVNYADGFHHAKEESLLFPRLAEKGFSMQQGPVAVMLSEHANGRDFVKKMSMGLEAVSAGDTSGWYRVYENMLAYGELLRNHIAKENNILFRMADNVLSAEDQQALLKEFSKVENSNACGEFLTNYKTSIEEMEAVYRL